MNRYKLSKIIIVFIGILIFTLLICFGLMVRFIGSVKVYPDRDIVVSEDYISYRRDNDLWAGDHLGNSFFTMGSSGCLVTCIASVMNNVDSKILNEKFSLHNVYDYEENFLNAFLKII